jgi:hypothetical protein
LHKQRWARFGLGLASAGLVAAAMVGTLAAPALERLIGNRHMAVLTSFAVVVALGGAALCWTNNLPAIAYGCVLIALSADAASDLGFASRMPVLARLSALRISRNVTDDFALS